MDGLVTALATSAPTAFGNLVPWGDPSWYRCVWFPFCSVAAVAVCLVSVQQP
jgi:hypothetical protein